jgi:uncharacterized protein YkwD
LIDAAKHHARDMAQKNYVSHRNKKGEDYSDRVMYDHVGENIAKTHDNGDHPKTIANRIVGQWMASPQHRHNILKSTYTHSGVGVWKKGNRVYAVQMYAKPRGAKLVRKVKKILPV